QWQQRLWAASLQYLLTLDTAEITPAIYLQALARGVSDETGVQITLRAWYEALAQGEIGDKAQTAGFQQLPEYRLEERKIDPKAIAALQQQTLPENDPTHKNQDEPITAEPVSAGSTFQPMAPQSRTGFETLYVTAMAELRRLGLIHERLAVVEEGIPPADLRQRLRTALRAIAVHDWVNQLAQSVRMDIAYLLAPPAAVLNEHLLAHADTLYRATARIEQSSEKQWEQRLWTASMRYLLAEDTANIAPAAYLQALARGVLGEVDAQATLQAWHEALAQRNTSGALQTLLKGLAASTQAEERADAAHSESAKLEAIKETENVEEIRLPEITAQPAEAEQARPVHEALYFRIVAALQQAKLIDAEFASSVLRLQADERRQRLHRLLQSPAIKPQLLQLAQPVLLDISYWLSPPAALLIERLLAHSAALYRLSGSSGKATQKHWKQRLWGASLDYFLSETATEIDPAAYLQTLVRAVSPAGANLQTTLRAWHVALEHSQTGSAIAALLRTLIGGAPAWQQTAEEISHSVQELNPASEAHAAYWQVQQRFTTGQPAAGYSLNALLETLATNHPAQLRQLYRDLRSPRYDVTVAQLDAIELHSLVEQLLHMESANDTADRHTFLQAIEKYADHANDRQAYYRLLLEELLHDREIDLEAIATQSQQTSFQASNAREDWNEPGKQAKQAETESATGSTSQHSTEQHSPAGDGALYATVIAALREAQLIDAHHAMVETSTQPAELRQRLRMTLSTIAVPDWVNKLPPSIRMEIAYLLAPQAAVLNEHLLAQTDKLYRVTGLTGQSDRQQWQQRLWAASLQYLLTLDTAEITPAIYLQALARGVSDETGVQITLRAWYEALARNKTAAAIRLLLQALIETPAESLHSGKENPLVETGVSPPVPVEQAAAIDWDALLNRTEQTDVTEEIYIDNAGQVLAAPYLPRLFSMLKLVEEGAFVDRQAAERAVHLLQFMVNEQTQSPEYQLTLNKILCGVSTGIPICREIAISAQEQETIEGLMRGMIQNWKTIGNTSISGLRETFLRRKGRLQLKEDGMWYLTVEPGVFDMLLDSLPWSFSVIKHSWMERAVHVTWR
ncbi:MAG: hypothetical protein DU489_15690, partial [Nitrosomonas sp.]|uniref:contractile injection system tape measure protein n=1 Tax=Nitrosomonas sp. TaxID=42353 RepID=UPI0032EE293D